LQKVPEWIWGSQDEPPSSLPPARDSAAPSRKNSPVKALTSPFAHARQEHWRKPPRTFRSVLAAKSSTKRSMSLIPQQLGHSSPPPKPASAASTFVLPIPAVLRLTLFKNIKPEDWRPAVDQLLKSTIYFARETLPRMQKNKWGRLITIIPSAVKQPVDGLLLSNSVRAAVTGTSIAVGGLVRCLL
jgi:hypothetical protein